MIEMKTLGEDEIVKEVKIEKNTYLSEIFGRIKNYIEEAIIIFNVENYQHKDNYELIAKFHIVIEKEISNCLILLNKIDLSTNPELDKDNCKSLIVKYFPRCQTFNLNLNTFIPLSLEQVQNELLLNDSFSHFIYYLFYNYMIKIKEMTGPSANRPSFINHLKEIIQKFKKIEVKDIKSKVNDLNKSTNISDINKEIKTMIDYLLKKFEGNEINFGFSRTDFDDDKDDSDDENEDENSEDDDKDNFDKISNSFIIKILYIYHKEKSLIPPISKETMDLLNYFQTRKKLIRLVSNKNLAITNGKKSAELEKYFAWLVDKLKKSKIDITNIQNLIDEITDTIKFVNLSDQIFIPFLGPSNAGKTTIINGIIGRNILPTDLKECTKRGILISYSDQEDDEISIYKSSFIEGKCFNKTYYYLDDGHIIGKGLNQVHSLLKGLNYEFTDKEEDCFYYIKTKIKLFDELGLNDSLKRQIYLIDFPGYGTSNNFMEKGICKQIIGISSAFIFVLRNSIIKENKTKHIIQNIFEQTKTQKKKLYSGIIKSCSFILNNDNTQTTNDTDIQQAKKDIQEIIDLDKDTIDTNKINLSFFNAKYFCDYRNDYIYFFNLEETFENEYNNFLDSKKKIFKHPEYFKSKKNNSFCDFLTTQLNEKLKNKFKIDSKKIKSQVINDNAKKVLDKIFDKYKDLQYIKIDEMFKKDEIIKKIVSYGQDKINDLATLKESNIESLKNLLNYQFKYNYNNLKEDLGNKIDNILSTLDEYFPLELSIDQSNLKEIEKLNVDMAIIKNRLNILLIDNENNIKNLFNAYQKYIKQILYDKKQDMENIIKKEKSENILKEIDIEIKEKQKIINDEIKKIIDNITKETADTFEEGNKQIMEFSDKTIRLNLLAKFDEYLSCEIGDKNKKNLMRQLFLEINCVTDLSRIYEVKGFGDFIKSTFSNYHYIMNNIDIILSNIIKKMDYISLLLKDNLSRYIQGLYLNINKALDLASIRFTEKQSKIWKEIGDYYHSNKEQIIKAKNDILQRNMNN